MSIVIKPWEIIGAGSLVVSTVLAATYFYARNPFAATLILLFSLLLLGTAAIGLRRSKVKYEVLHIAHNVECSIFSPHLVAPGDNILIQVFAHKLGQGRLVEREAKTADITTQKRGRKALEEPLRPGMETVFHLEIPSIYIDEPDLPLIWRGKTASVQFSATVPKEHKHGRVMGKVLISRDRIPIGHIKFIINVVSPEVRERADADAIKGLQGYLCRYNSAFVSYALKDREEVFPRVQALLAAKIRVSLDILNLDPGERWEKGLYRRINDCDVFFLFWSQAAKDSEWVQKEILYAHKMQGGREDAPPEIIPIIIEGPPPVKPPPELDFLHFNDKFIYLMAGAKVETEARQKQV